MNSLLTALQTKDTFTENMMPTHSTSGSPIVDLFYTMGGAKAMNISDFMNTFIRAFADERLLTVKAMFYNRDVRGGQGQRATFRCMLHWMCVNYPDIVRKNLALVPKFGRWDDVLVAFGTPVEKDMIKLIHAALTGGDALCAKWMPREGKSLHEVAKRLIYGLGWSRKQYRRTLAHLTKVVETDMCNREFAGINYNHVPSKASHKYRKAFATHDHARYDAWIKSLSDPKSGNKIHADAIYPSDIVNPYLHLRSGQDATIEAQWKALPDFVGDLNFLPVCDVSGSMTTSGGEPLRVCVALGLYLSERNKGAFKDAFVTFSGRPQLQYLKGNLFERVQQLKTAAWETNTNLEAVFYLILNQARLHGVPESDMPGTVLILSDMQFDQCIRVPSLSGMEMIRKMYAEAGYKLPNVVFWNLRTSSGIPVKFDERGTALVSGYSPTIMKNILNGDMDPMKIVLRTLNSDRYSDIRI